MDAWDQVEKAFIQAASGQADWNLAMDAVSSATGSYGALLFPVHGQLAALPLSVAMQESTQAYFQGGWHERDERWAGLSHLKAKGITTEFDFTTPELMRRSAYYEDFLRPHGLRWFAALCLRSGDEVWSLSLQRTIEQGPFQPQELAKLQPLAQRLHAAADISRAMGTARIEGASRAFQMSETPVVFLDRRAEVILANPVADTLFREGDIRLSGKHLQLATPAATLKLEQAIRTVLRAQSSQSSEVVRVPRSEGRGLLARIIHFSDVQQDPMSLCRAVVIFLDLDHRKASQVETWPELFGLTPAECRLVELLVSGSTIEQAAHVLGLSRETLRTRLKSVFGKLQISRQADLVSLFARLT